MNPLSFLLRKALGPGAQCHSGGSCAPEPGSRRGGGVRVGAKPNDAIHHGNPTACPRPGTRVNPRDPPPPQMAGSNEFSYSFLAATWQPMLKKSRRLRRPDISGWGGATQEGERDET